jgi:hypothetical protein
LPAPEEVLEPAILPRVVVATTDIAHEDCVELANESERVRQACKPLQPVFESLGIVVDHAHIIAGSGRSVRCLEDEEYLESGDRALDPAREHRFPAEERPDEEMRVRHHPADAGEFAHASIGLRQRLNERQCQFDCGRQRIGDKR